MTWITLCLCAGLLLAGFALGVVTVLWLLDRALGGG